MQSSEVIRPARFAAADLIKTEDKGAELVFTGVRIPLYHREVLQRGHCRGFLPAYFMEVGQQVRMVVETEGYLPVLEHKRKKAKSRWLCCSQEMLAVLESLVETIRDNEEHLFFIRQYELTPETVFLHSKHQAVKLLYRYAEETEQSGFAQKLTHFMEVLEENETDKEWLFYSQHIRRESVRDNLGPASVLKLIRRLKEETLGGQWGAGSD